MKHKHLIFGLALLVLLLAAYALAVLPGVQAMQPVLTDRSTVAARRAALAPPMEPLPAALRDAPPASAPEPAPEPEPKPAATPVAPPAAAASAGASAAASAPQAAARALRSPVFVLNSLDGDVSVIDPTRWTEIKRIPTGKEPHHLYMTPDEKSVIVANALADSLTFIDPRTAEVQRTIRNILDPYHLRFSPDMKWFVTNANRLNHVDIYRWDGENPQLVKRIVTAKTPSHLWIDTRSTVVYSSMQDSDELVTIDLASQQLTHRVKTGAMPADIFVTPDDKTLLLGLTGGTGVQVFDVSGVAQGQPPVYRQTLATGKGAHAFRAAGDGAHLWVSNRVDNTISRINYRTLTVEQTLPVGAGPDCMDVAPDGKTLLVGLRWARQLAVVNAGTGQVERRVPVGKSPHGVWTLDHAPRL